MPSSRRSGGVRNSSGPKPEPTTASSGRKTALRPPPAKREAPAPTRWPGWTPQGEPDEPAHDVSISADTDPEWEQEHHATEHVVYLSHTGGVKVGITRSTQVPVRWIDQGAVAALVIARVPYRQLAGLIEVDLKRVFADRTNWRAMLKKVPVDHEALLAARELAYRTLREDLQQHLLPDALPLDINYPVLAYPPKVTSVSLLKTPEVIGKLMGVKGQYLIWEDGRVLNVRNQSGIHVEVI